MSCQTEDCVGDFGCIMYEDDCIITATAPATLAAATLAALTPDY